MKWNEDRISGLYALRKKRGREQLAATPCSLILQIFTYISDSWFLIRLIRIMIHLIKIKRVKYQQRRHAILK